MSTRYKMIHPIEAFAIRLKINDENIENGLFTLGDLKNISSRYEYMVKILFLELYEVAYFIHSNNKETVGKEDFHSFSKHSEDQKEHVPLITKDIVYFFMRNRRIQRTIDYFDNLDTTKLNFDDLDNKICVSHSKILEIANFYLNKPFNITKPAIEAISQFIENVIIHHSLFADFYHEQYIGTPLEYNSREINLVPYSWYILRGKEPLNTILKLGKSISHCITSIVNMIIILKTKFSHGTNHINSSLIKCCISIIIREKLTVDDIKDSTKIPSKILFRKFFPRSYSIDEEALYILQIFTYILFFRIELLMKVENYFSYSQCDFNFSTLEFFSDKDLITRDTIFEVEKSVPDNSNQIIQENKELRTEIICCDYSPSEDEIRINEMQKEEISKFKLSRERSNIDRLSSLKSVKCSYITRIRTMDDFTSNGVDDFKNFLSGIKIEL